MSFNSIDFLIFLPVVLFLYYLLPVKFRNIWLLLSSYYFYMCWNVKYVLLILFITAVSYVSGRLLELRRHKRGILLTCTFTIILILLYFKYFNFLLENITAFLSIYSIQVNLPQTDVLLPVGISFYTFQALGYVIDVYRGDTYAEKNFLKYALFISFFPQLVAGPIERSKNLLKQLARPQKFLFKNLYDGLYIMLWGFFLKMVLSDRIAIYVDNVYGDYDTYPGFFLVVATFLFAFQIYCDFAGYSIIAMGAAKMLGIKLMENFNAPYLSRSVSEFWRKWHISLSSWLKDYIYIPLGGNRRGKFRQNLNLIITFGVSGIWHGASWGYLIWGVLNGAYQIVGRQLAPLREKVIRKIPLNGILHKVLGVLITFLLVDFSWIFFRAPQLKDAVQIMKSIFTVWNPWIVFDGSLYTCGLDAKNFGLMILGMTVLFFVDLAKHYGINVSCILKRQNWLLQTILIPFMIIFIVIFGIWGDSYNAAEFIYFQF